MAEVDYRERNSDNGDSSDEIVDPKVNVNNANIKQERKSIYGEDMYIIRKKKAEFICKYCSKELSGSGSLRRHQKSCSAKPENAKDEPEIREVVEENHSDSETSEITIEGKKLIQCKLCVYNCNLRSKMKIHLRVHSGERPFSCNVCDYTCSHSGNLKVHIRTHTGERPFACPDCSYTSPQINRLKTHLRTHTGEKPYACDLCPFSCTLANNLKIHKRTHTNEKPFVCHVCNYSCKHLSNLKKHVTIHLAKLSCEICSFKTLDTSLFAAHMEEHESRPVIL